VVPLVVVVLNELGHGHAKVTLAKGHELAQAVGLDGQNETVAPGTFHQCTTRERSSPQNTVSVHERALAQGRR
jgi:hypothetical protein